MSEARCDYCQTEVSQLERVVKTEHGVRICPQCAETAWMGLHHYQTALETQDPNPDPHTSLREDWSFSESNKRCDFCGDSNQGNAAVTAAAGACICTSCAERVSKKLNPLRVPLPEPGTIARRPLDQKIALGMHVLGARIWGGLLVLLTVFRPYVIPYFLVPGAKLGRSESEVTLVGARTGIAAEAVTMIGSCVLHSLCLVVSLYLVMRMWSEAHRGTDEDGYDLHRYALMGIVLFAALRAGMYYL